MSFAGIERLLAGMSDEEKTTTAKALTFTKDEQRKLLHQMNSFSCYEIRSSKYIKNIFMQRFSVMKLQMIQALHSTIATSLSLDHTFRFNKKVQIQISRGQNYEKAGNSLLLVLNEVGEL